MSAPDSAAMMQAASTTATASSTPSGFFGGSDCSHIQATRDGAGLTLSQGLGDFPRQVFLNIRHNHPTLGLGDVAFQRLHQGHTHQTTGRGGVVGGGIARAEVEEEGGGGAGGVVSLGLPLGISSLKLSGNTRKKKREKGAANSRAATTLYKQGKNNSSSSGNNNNAYMDSGHFSDGELLSRERSYKRLQQQQQQQYINQHDQPPHPQLYSWHHEQQQQQPQQQHQQRDMTALIQRNLWAEGGTPTNNNTTCWEKEFPAQKGQDTI